MKEQPVMLTVFTTNVKKWHSKKQMLHLTDGSMELDFVHRQRSILKNTNESKA